MWPEWAQFQLGELVNTIKMNIKVENSPLKSYDGTTYPRRTTLFHLARNWLRLFAATYLGRIDWIFQWKISTLLEGEREEILPPENEYFSSCVVQILNRTTIVIKKTSLSSNNFYQQSNCGLYSSFRIITRTV